VRRRDRRALVRHPGTADPRAGRDGPGDVMSAVHYRVSHRTTYEYSQPMTDGYTLAYLLPRPTPQQMVGRALVEVEPDVDDREEHTDAFGNRVLQFGVYHQHDALRLHATAEVVFEPMYLDGDGPPWESVAAAVRSCRTRGARCGCPRSAGSTSTRPTTICRCIATSRWRGAATTTTCRRCAAW